MSPIGRARLMSLRSCPMAISMARYESDFMTLVEYPAERTAARHHTSGARAPSDRALAL